MREARLGAMESYDEIKAMSDAEVVDRFNGRAGNTDPALDFCAGEMHRRQLARSAQLVAWMTGTNLVVAVIASVGGDPGARRHHLSVHGRERQHPSAAGRRVALALPFLSAVRDPVEKSSRRTHPRVGPLAIGEHGDDRSGVGIHPLPSSLLLAKHAQPRFILLTNGGTHGSAGAQNVGREVSDNTADIARPPRPVPPDIRHG